MMKSARFHIGLFLLVVLAACDPRGPGRSHRADGPPSPVAPTFGEAAILEGGGYLVRYKSITVLVDRGRPPRFAPVIDYLLVTGREEAVERVIAGPIRRDVKTIASGPAADRLTDAGFVSVKSLSGGGALLLQKNDDFLFVRTAEGAPGTVYFFLEFDNGRGVFIAAKPVVSDSSRAFLYSLRDEGKEVHLGLIAVGRDAVSPPVSNEGAAALAALLGLFQPKLAVVSFLDGDAPPAFDESFHRALRDEYFTGVIEAGHPGMSVAF